jgi:prepilin-type N-terminal cleavage/methylation domain-containing protein
LTVARRPLRRLSAEGGYSLIEVLVVLVVLTIVVTGLTTIFASGSSAETRLNNRFQAQTNARLALDRMRKELHNACGVATNNATLIQFGFPNNCPLAGVTATVTYCTAGTGTKFKLYRIAAAAATCTGTAAVPIIDNLTSGSIFTYVPKNTPSGSYLLGRIKVDLQVNITPGTTANRYRLIDDIVMRNTGRS